MNNRESIRQAWVQACNFDGIPPESSFVVFSKETPYAREQSPTRRLAMKHPIPMTFYIETEVQPETPEGLAEYLFQVGQNIVDSIPRDWFEPTEEYLHITSVEINTEQ